MGCGVPKPHPYLEGLTSRLQAVKWSVQQNANALSTCRHFVAMLGDKAWDERRRVGTSVTVLRYETGTTMTRWGGQRLAVAIF